MDAKDLDAALASAGLDRLAGAVRLHTSYWLRDDPAGAGQLGGRCSLPPSVSWPTWQQRPLDFLARVSLPSPSAVDLLFFFDTERLPWGHSESHLGAARVVPIPRSTESSGGVRVSATQISELPDPFGLHCESLSLSPDELLRLGALRRSLLPARPYHHLFGEPASVQEDPRATCGLMADRLGWAGQSWLLLLQLDSDDGLGWNWGDEGRLFFCIGDQDLSAGEFGRCWAVVQTS